MGESGASRFALRICCCLRVFYGRGLHVDPPNGGRAVWCEHIGARHGHHPARKHYRPDLVALPGLRSAGTLRQLPGPYGGCLRNRHDWSVSHYRDAEAFTITSARRTATHRWSDLVVYEHLVGAFQSTLPHAFVRCLGFLTQPALRDSSPEWVRTFYPVAIRTFH